MNIDLGILSGKKKGAMIWMIFLTVAGFSCNKGPQNGKEMNDGTTYYLEKVDSIRVDRETNIRVLGDKKNK